MKSARFVRPWMLALAVVGAGFLPFAAGAWGVHQRYMVRQAPVVTAPYWCGSYYSSYPCPRYQEYRPYGYQTYMSPYYTQNYQYTNSYYDRRYQYQMPVYTYQTYYAPQEMYYDTGYTQNNWYYSASQYENYNWNY